MANKTQRIVIESILGGHAPTMHFAQKDQFLSSIGIDPGLAIQSTAQAFDIEQSIPSGLLRPVTIQGVGTTASYPQWITPHPKSEGTLYIYDSVGSVYSTTDQFTSITGVGDLNDGGTSGGNGAAYYDNYIYFSRSTTVARYGPLNGTPSFTDDYWSGSLGLTPLTNTSYPSGFYFGLPYPNHVLHRHSDGRLYIADVVGNQGTVHYIQTSKTTAEGDTNSGSTYNAIQVGYGLHPTAMESYGNNLVIAFAELTPGTGSRTLKTERAKVAFWDTTSQNVNSLTLHEFPDQIISAIKNVNGVLYFVSGNQYCVGFRLTRYIGGNSFDEVAYIPSGDIPMAGAVDTDSRRLFFGTSTDFPHPTSSTRGCVYSYGLAGLNTPGLFNTVSISPFNGDNTISPDGSMVTALSVSSLLRYGLFEASPVIGYTNNPYHGVVVPDPSSNADYSTVQPIWWSQIYRIGQPFKITKIRIPLAQKLSSGASVTVKVYKDSKSSTGTTTVGTISYTAHGGNTQNIILRPNNLTCDNNFFLGLEWTGSTLCVIGLPITIEYELIDD